MAGKQVEIAADGGKFEGYVAAPDSGKVPGVILVSSIFGLDQNMKHMCDDLAQRGCVALVQNFFWRDKDSSPLKMEDFQRAVARAQRIDFPKSMVDLEHGIAEVKHHRNCNGKVAVFGFCFGGPYAWRAACDGLEVDAAVSFHGTFVSKSMKPGDHPGCPVSLHYGDQDELAPPPELEAVKKVADATGSEFVVHHGAGHGYMMHAHSHEDREAARNSWDRALQMIGVLRTEAESQHFASS